MGPCQGRGIRYHPRLTMTANDRSKLRTSRSPRATSALGTRGAWVLAGVAASWGCSTDSATSDAFSLRTSAYVAADDPRDQVVGDLGVFFVDESAQDGGPTDLNGDGDTTDLVPVVLRFDDLTEQLLPVAPTEVLIAGAFVFCTVDETGNRDWDGDPLVDSRALVRWTLGEEDATFVATLDPDSPVGAVAVGNDVYFAADEVPGPDQSNLKRLSLFDLATVDAVAVESAPLGIGPALATGRSNLLGTSGGLVLVGVDETDPDSQGNANGDADADDVAVLCVIDPVSDPLKLVGIGQALATSDAGVSVLFEGGTRYELVFAVDESQQGASNLNGSFTPSPCPAADADLSDRVLHYAVFEDGALQELTNTTIAAAGEPFQTTDYLGALVEEVSIGPAGCDLSGDGNVDDTVLRFAPKLMPDQPVDLLDLYLAIDAGIAGGSGGLVVGPNRFAIAVHPEEGLGPLPFIAPALAQLDPVSQTQWQTLFSDADGQAPPLEAALAWMGPGFQGGRVAILLLEQGLGFNANVDCGLALKDGGTPDQSDALPGVLRFASGGGAVLSGFGWACADDTTPLPELSGPRIAFGQAFFAVDEAADGVDWNGDGALDDRLLLRSPLQGCQAAEMAQIRRSDAPPIVTDGGRGAFLFTDEVEVGQDINGDGAIAGLALRYFRAF